jgi:hypothetical protein
LDSGFDEFLTVIWNHPVNQSTNTKTKQFANIIAVNHTLFLEYLEVDTNQLRLVNGFKQL